MNASDIITAKGGPTAIATAIGYKANAVRQWKFHGFIPRKAWPDLIRAYPDLTLDVLLKTERAA